MGRERAMKQLKKIVMMLVLAMMLTSVPAAVQAASVQSVQTATVKNGLRKENGKYYYYVKGKKLLSSWKTITQSGVAYRYYFGANGAAYAGTRVNNQNRNILRKIGNYQYAFDYKGHMLKGVQTIYSAYQFKLYAFSKTNGHLYPEASKTLQQLSTVKVTFTGTVYPAYGKLKAKLKALGEKELKVTFMCDSCFGDGRDGTITYPTFTLSIFKYRESGLCIVMDVQSR